MGCSYSSSEHGPIRAFYSDSEQQPFEMDSKPQEGGLHDYLELESQIRANEVGNPVQILQVKSQRWHQVQNELQTAQRELEALEKLVATDLGLDYGPRSEVSVETAIHKFSLAETSNIQDQQEYFALLNKEEIAHKAVHSLMTEKENLEKEMKQLRTKVSYLNLLYRKQDQLLDKIFGADYASERENLLEAELDLIEQKKAAIVQISALWSQARLMVQIASNQLATALQLWSTLPLQTTNGSMKFQIAADVRDNLVAAGQNLLGAHQNLYHVSFPYCTLEELATLSKATTYVFSDMQSSDRHTHAEECYRTTYLRSRVLLQWMDQVIRNVIGRDLQTVTAQFQEKTQQLRLERINLIIAKANGPHPSGRAVFMEFEKQHERKVATALDGSLGLSELQDEIIGNADLAPIPTSAEIFGRVNQLAADHQQELQRYIDSLSSTKGRISSRLHEVLNERRRRHYFESSEERVDIEA